MLYNPNEELLKSGTGKPVIPPRALTNMEKEMSADYIFFNSTGQFRHKYSIQDYPSASDVIDFETFGKNIVISFSPGIFLRNHMMMCCKWRIYDRTAFDQGLVRPKANHSLSFTDH